MSCSLEAAVLPSAGRVEYREAKAVEGEVTFHKLERGDFSGDAKIYRGLAKTLSALREVNLNPDDARKIFDKREARKTRTYLLLNQEGEVVATASLLIEYKFIRSGGKVAHIEDVAVGKEFQRRGFGSLLLQKVVAIAKEKGCYKAILDCSEDTVRFYQSVGFYRHEIEMRLDL